MEVYKFLTAAYCQTVNQFVRISRILPNSIMSLPLRNLTTQLWTAGWTRKITSILSRSVHLQKKEEHNHVCKWCEREYIHYHPFTNANHRQFRKQCPFNDCSEYHQGDNPTHSKPVVKKEKDQITRTNFNTVT